MNTRRVADLLRQLADEIDPPEPAKPVQGAMEGAARVLTAFAYEVSELPNDPSLYDDMAKALAESQLLSAPQPMTVGQLGVEHIGKRVETTGSFAGSFEAILVGFKHETSLYGPDEYNRYPVDTPCTVVDE